MRKGYSADMPCAACGHEAWSHVTKDGHCVARTTLGRACDCKHFEPDGTFHVDVSGVRSLSDAPYYEAKCFADLARAVGNHVRLYRADRDAPLPAKLPDRGTYHGDGSPTNINRIPRCPSMRVGDAERAKLLAALEAEGVLTYE